MTISSGGNGSRVREGVRYQAIKRLVYIILAVFAFFCSIELMSAAFRALGSGAAESIISATSNPFIGLFIGLLTTALIQSSSTSTAMIVAAVASESMTLEDAIPIIMGANIGTTLTSTIVSLGYITDKRAFRKAIAAGTVHDFFNILTVFLLFPLEYYYGLLSSSAVGIAKILAPIDVPPLSVHFLELAKLVGFITRIVDNGFILLVISFILLIGSLKLLSSLISKFLIGGSRTLLKNYVFNKPFQAFLWGMGLTATVQSSSVTTCLAVPLVATGQVPVKKSFPFIMGANIGTTITAFLAVLFNSSAAITIAIAHLLINLIGVLVFLPFPFLRKIPVSIANQFGNLTTKSRIVGFAYITLTFFIIPFVLIYFNKEEAEIKELTYIKTYTDDRKTEWRSVINKWVKNKKQISWTEYLPLPHSNSMENIPKEYGKFCVIYQKNNVLFFNERFYLIGKEGFCWDGEQDSRKYKICIEDIMNTMQLTEKLHFDSVYVYSKRYYPLEKQDNYTRYYISIKDKIYLRSELLDSEGAPLSSEKLIDINPI